MVHKTPVRFGYKDVVAFAFNIVEEIEETEPKSFQEVMRLRDKGQWLKAMED